mmetsp:Transcript_17687/g.29900  ORF Transcript_17687/g.29900 Transcript_17687/m.29900 type:complete len:81 (+) Transcript_17687:2406-2648(+)
MPSSPKSANDLLCNQEIALTSNFDIKDLNNVEATPNGSNNFHQLAAAPVSDLDVHLHGVKRAHRSSNSFDNKLDNSSNDP